ncbi:co-chaperone HscB [Catenovulum maritimum]|jgi:molecular chaperone HscB|uniref:Co-chaperone protein HscB homolog n=1 Tax=Catenovulum maritimum TaxID=1513271 RepID=A0A0J8GS31_9ALTE|nr:co-chaperone HscB [Catenovulum maritimum]KMT65522.1 cobalamin 5'-phosphate synthase [Catenovulum maritimum]
MNYFDLFKLPVSFELDSKKLAADYRLLQRHFHPDQYANASDGEKLLAVKKAAEINDAFTTLKSPIARAEYILSLNGLDIAHETQTIQDTAFLMQQMEYREHLEDIENNPDPFDAIVEFEAELAQHVKLFQNQLATQLAESLYNEAADSVRKLKFIVKLQTELERLEDQVAQV